MAVDRKNAIHLPIEYGNEKKVSVKRKIYKNKKKIALLPDSLAHQAHIITNAFF